MNAVPLNDAGLTDAPQRVDEEDLLAARRLAARGEDAAAITAYMELIARDATHFQALTEFARLAFAGGYRSAARTAYEQAVDHHAQEPLAHVNLANVLRDSAEPVAAKRHYLKALQLDADYAPAHQGLAQVLAEEGDEAGARHHRDRGFMGRAVLLKPYRGTRTAQRILLIVSARGGNIPTDLWLNDRRYAVTAVYAEYADPTSALPAHDLVFNAIGDADLCVEALDAADRIVAKTDKPVLNRPERVQTTGRAATAARLRGIPCVQAPVTHLMSSDAIRELPKISFPVLVRRPGYHTGQHFHRADNRIALISALDEFEAQGAHELLLIDYLDASGPDGNPRKYRVMFIDGALYPLHLAVSRDWKVHYFTAAMADDAAFRAEERRFLDNPASVVGAPGWAGLHEIAARLQLDYAGIDFGLAPDGTILVFEVNATMVLIPPAPDPVWDYRRPAIGRAFDAASRMLERHLALTH